MAALTEDHQRFIVRELAHFRQPATVARLFREAFKAEIAAGEVDAIDSKQVWEYDPTRRKEKGRIRADLVQLFKRERRRFLKAEAEVGVTHRMYRVEALHRMAEKAEGQGNMALAAQLLEQAAKEMGGSYTKTAADDRLPVEFTLNVGSPMTAQDKDG